MARNDERQEEGLTKAELLAPVRSKGINAASAGKSRSPAGREDAAILEKSLNAADTDKGQEHARRRNHDQFQMLSIEER
jgi:hypothetical protein